MSRQDGPALMLKYRTNGRIDDKQTLEGEIDDVFSLFKFDCQNVGMRTCIVSANEPQKGWFITKNRAFNAVFVRSDAGIGLSGPSAKISKFIAKTCK
jgi:hypothetical protein